MVKTLKLRITDKFVGTYQHEDKWKDVGDCETIQSERWIRDSDDMTEPVREEYWVWVYPNFGVPEKDIAQALIDSFSYVGCHHDYDCCGCRSFYASNPTLLTQEGTREEWKITVNSYRNY